MSFSISEGWLQPANHVPSPNFDTRPGDCAVDLLVIHNISLPPGQFGSGCVQQFFCNTLDCTQHPYFQRLVDLRVSSHLLIERTGQVTQFVSFEHRAWHAGESFFEDRTRCNDFSIGIELEGVDDHPYTDAQYEMLAGVTQTLLQTYPAMTPNRITGHSDIAPGRKTDPGPAFDWRRYRSTLAAGC
ncbi:1,6-anhydro-N-acetylmuramyl-L-alanine amidase AmpD [Gilvimarinus sp. F26214L]|uniref:1,6-anhydro-N-acetylmuramyl-L-alanine amidase AmpD n=1 Tax=Gilvimarinus sp. DZF01 TaxID=3461371 RepID=UPI004045E9D5